MIVQNLDELEAERLILQRQLDNSKTQAERNRLGQFATPTALARDILHHAKTLLPVNERVKFFDPAIGTGSFYSALLTTFSASRIDAAQGFEIDGHYGHPSAQLWAETDLSLILNDFTQQVPNRRFNLVVCNPPYVRHHHIQADEKARLQLRTMQASGMKLAGLAGLYCHFLGLSHTWLADDALSCWLIPSEFMDVNYGQAVKRYLLERVTLLHVHRFDPNDVQFADALVSSAVVWFRNALAPPDHGVTFSFGGPITNPSSTKTVPVGALASEPKWTRFPVSGIRSRSVVPSVSNFFKITRGLVTGDNKYFILNTDEIEARQLPLQCFRPILPSPRYVKADEIKADAAGFPVLEPRLFLLDPKLPEREIRMRYATLWAYLEEGKAKGLHKRYLCSHRNPLYRQESRPPAPVVCTYFGRIDTQSGRPFRFILNQSLATVANVYLAMYPTPMLARAIGREPALMRRVWEALNRITPEQLLGEGRVYGGGLHKLEPKELANVPMAELADIMVNGVHLERQEELMLDVT